LQLLLDDFRVLSKVAFALTPLAELSYRHDLSDTLRACSADNAAPIQVCQLLTETNDWISDICHTSLTSFSRSLAEMEQLQKQGCSPKRSGGRLKQDLDKDL